MSIYLSRPWTKMYDPGAPASLEPYPTGAMHQQLEKTATENGHKVACITSAPLPLLGRVGATVTWGEINAAAARMAAGLAAAGIEKGDVVAIIMPNCVQFIVAFYAILKAGGIISATNPTYPPAKMAEQINDSGAKCVIALSMFYRPFKSVQSQTQVQTVVVTRFKEYLPGAARALFTLAKEKKSAHYLPALESGDMWFQDLLAQHSPADQPSISIDAAEDIAIYQYTGGTTGVPKGAMSTHRALVANTYTMQCWLPSEDPSAEVLLAAIPFFHVYGLVAIVAYAASAAASVIIVPNARDVDDLLGNMVRWQPTIFMGVPALFNALNNHADVKSGKADLTLLRVCFSGSAPLAPDTKRRFEKLATTTIVEGFGMSEAPTASHGNPLGRPGKEQSVGVPFPDTDCRIVSVDDGVTDMPVGEAGELIMRGPNTMKGYLNMPEETDNALRDLGDGGPPWLYTGDIAYMDEDGYFFIVDRKKDMALIGGFNVYPTAVEKVLADHPDVQEVGVTRIPHPEKEGQEALLACVVLHPDQSVSVEDLIEFQSQKVAPHEIARRVAFLDELPKTAVGKTLRRDLAQTAG